MDGYDPKPVQESIIKHTKTDSEIKKIRQSSINFLTTCQKILNEALLKRHIDKIEGSILNMDKFIKELNDQTREKLIQAQFLFESQLNEFLERKIHLAYVIETGQGSSQIFFISEDDAKGIYASADKWGKASLSSNSTFGGLDDLIKNFSKIQNQQIKNQAQQIINQRQIMYRAMYHVAGARLEKNKSVDENSFFKTGRGKKKIDYKKWARFGQRFYWIKNPNVSKRSKNYLDKKYGAPEKTMNHGHLAESFLSLLLDDKKIQLFGNIENQLQGFSNYMKAIDFRNTTPGVVKGDISLKLTGQTATVQFAVKSNSFSLPSILPYIRAAINITSMSEEKLTIESVQGMLDSISKNKEEVEKRLNNKIKKILDDSIKQLELKGEK